MTYPPHPRPLFTLKASRDTLLLVATAVGITLALSYAVHQRSAPPVVAAEAPAAAPQVWVGQLPNATPVDTVTRAAEPITSASLVVAPSELAALPSSPSRVNAAAKPRPCDTASCPTVAKPSGVASSPASPPQAVPPVAKAASTHVADNEPAHGPVEKTSFASRLNPLNHIPDSIRHPIDAAGDTLSGWMKRL